MRGLPVRIVAALTTTGMIAANLLANALPFFGRDTGEVSARFPTLVTPAGYVFAIWGLIYLGLVALSVAQSSSCCATTSFPSVSRCRSS